MATSVDDITLTITTPAGATLTCDANPVAAVAGVATFTGCSVDKAGVGYTLTATMTGPITGVSNAFTITIGPADHVAFTAGDPSVFGGTPFAIQPKAEIRDAGINRIVASGVSITIAIDPAANPSGGTLSGTKTVLTDGTGVASWSGLSIDKAGSGYRLLATSAGVTADRTGLIDVAVGPAAKLAFGQGPTSTLQGVAISPAMTVQVQDLGGNLVTTDVSSVHLAIGTNPSGGTLSGTSTVAAVAGVATFSNISINLAGVGYTLTATDGGLTPITSAAFTITLQPNHAPSGTNKTITVVQNVPYVFSVSDFGFSDPSDVPANTLLSVRIATLPAKGTLRDNGATFAAGTSIPVADITGGKLIFTPVANAIGAPYATFTFQVRDNGGTAGGGVDLDPSANTITLNVVKDTFKPTTSGPVPSVAGQTIGSTTVVVRLTWTGADVGSGIARYQLQESRNGAAYVTVSLSSALSRSANRTLNLSDTYRARVRAVDKVGNVGAWTYSGSRIKVLRYQESSVTFTGTWTYRTSVSYSGGHERTTSATGAAASFTSTGRVFSWVGAKGTNRGTAQVYVDGVLDRTLDLAQTTRVYRYAVYSKTFATPGSHTIRIVFTGASPKLIDVDAFILLR